MEENLFYIFNVEKDNLYKSFKLSRYKLSKADSNLIKYSLNLNSLDYDIKSGKFELILMKLSNMYSDEESLLNIALITINEMLKDVIFKYNDITGLNIYLYYKNKYNILYKYYLEIKLNKTKSNVNYNLLKNTIEYILNN